MSDETRLSCEEPFNVLQLATQLRLNLSTPGDLLSVCLERISRLDQQVGAFTWMNDEAWADAERLGDELRAGKDRGPLHGIPIGVKELFDVAGAPCSYGSQVLNPRRAVQDSAIVAKLREAGAIVVGTTRSHEFGWGITTQHEAGSTRNPWDTARIPGGSSGGSAAAVASGMVPLAVASDTGGSIRIPSAFCGVAGIKPTFGTVSRAGAVPLAPSFDTPGFISRDVAGLASALRIARGEDVNDPATVLVGREPQGWETGRSPKRSLAGLRIGHAPALTDGPFDTARTRAVYQALDRAAELGAEIVYLSTPTGEEFRTAFSILQMSEAYYIHSTILGTYPARSMQYGPDVRSRLEAAEVLTASEVTGAHQDSVRLRASLVSQMRRVDALITPISSVAPPLCSDPDTVIVDGTSLPLREAVMGSTTPQNLSGLPAVAFPFGLAEDGLPVGLQATSLPHRDETALLVARELELLPLPTDQQLKDQ